ncbi:zinc-ribbon domain-containing protein [Elioraea thermophila]|uniref:zinc-ribbon domain-containing protein n=1 Tax=Elioraea thermophila TaxID=2185104 RepID=UPI0013006312|nr:zinc-ribbon domain-containing protein [Elioraea thermophila]
MPRIACPNCGARYEIAAEVLGPAGKKVRCVRCGHVWLATPEGEAQASGPSDAPPWPEPRQVRVREPEEEPAAAPAVAATAPPPAPPTARPAASAIGAEPAGLSRAVSANERGTTALLAAWALSLAVLAAAAWGAIAYRAEVIDAWPASQRLYALLGLDG